MRKFWYLITFLMLCLVVFGALVAEAQPTGCPFGQGYWKNTAQWPVTQLTLGNQTYTQAELLILFNSPPQGDASLILADQLIAARLNIANGADATPVTSTIISSTPPTRL